MQQLENSKRNLFVGTLLLSLVTHRLLQTLGKRFKESMPKLKAAIAKLDREQIVSYEATGSLQVEGCHLEAGDLKVLSTFHHGLLCVPAAGYC